MHVKHLITVVTSLELIHILAWNGGAAVAAERGLSSYLPGYYGDFAVAVAPKPGFYGYTTNYNLSAEMEARDVKLELDASALIGGFQYVAPSKLGGFTYAVGAYSAIIDAQLNGDIGGRRIEQHKTQLADTAISPLIMYWSSGALHLNFYQTVFLSTGRFDAADPLNLSRNYYSIDTVTSLTWIDLQKGLEISLVPGLMYNFDNPTTNYQTGLEFHLDFMANFYLSQTFALGLHGYVYDQLEHDKIDDRPVSGVDSRSIAVGLSVLWVPKALGANSKIAGKWLHDIDTRDRFEGDILSLTGAISF